MTWNADVKLGSRSNEYIDFPIFCYDNKYNEHAYSVG